MARFLALAFYIVAAVSYSGAETVEELVQVADEAGAPFTETALTRMDDTGQWGAAREQRSTDVIIINGSGQTLKLVKSFCAQGQLSPYLLPECTLDPKSSTVYGIESSKDRQGVQCSISYEGETGVSFISININNPWDGKDAVYASASWDLKVTPVFSHGHNSQARFTVTDKYQV